MMNKLVFGDIEVSKKRFYEGKKGIKLSSVDVSKIAVSNKVKGNNETVLDIWMIMLIHRV